MLECVAILFCAEREGCLVQLVEHTSTDRYGAAHMICVDYYIYKPFIFLTHLRKDMDGMGVHAFQSRIRINNKYERQALVCL